MKLLLACLTLLAAASGAFACSCLPSTIEEDICNANYIVRLNLVKEFQLDETLVQTGFYATTIRAVYKGDGISKGQTKLYTGANSALCGYSQDLKKGKYVVTGYGSGDALWVNSCSSVVKTWDEMTSLVADLLGEQKAAKNDKQLGAMIESLCSK